MCKSQRQVPATGAQIDDHRRWETSELGDADLPEQLGLRPRNQSPAVGDQLDWAELHGALDVLERFTVSSTSNEETKTICRLDRDIGIADQIARTFFRRSEKEAAGLVSRQVRDFCQ